MRPGQEAPDGHSQGRKHTNIHLASMRPGQEAPDGPRRPLGLWPVMTKASMRPGQEAPDGLNASPQSQHPQNRFNEAGARSPGWPLWGYGALCGYLRFNEAGARSPGWPPTQAL